MLIADPAGAAMNALAPLAQQRQRPMQNPLGQVGQAQGGFNALALHGGPTRAAAADMGASPANIAPVSSRPQSAGMDSGIGAFSAQETETPQTLQIAGKAMGLNERDQKGAVQEYLRNGGVNLDPAVTAWCAAFVNSTLKQAGMEGTGKLNARSFLDWGESVDNPQPGDIAVFSRGDPNGWQGHVGFFQGFGEDGGVNILGGNQGDSVSVASYPRERLLGFRRAGGNPDPGIMMRPQRPAQDLQAPQRTASAQPASGGFDMNALYSLLGI